jgi:putative nucleotidyltransferase with HDIG domain
MNMKKITRIAQKAMVNRAAPPTREPGWIYHHGLRTAKIALWLNDQLLTDADPDVLFVGALFHDVGKDFEPHNETGAALVRKLLKKECTKQELKDIARMVRLHNQRRKTHDYPHSVTIVQDADALDHMGAIDVWMAFYWSGVHRETFRDHMKYFQGAKNARWRKSLREGLNYDLSVQEFDRRVAYEDEFFEHFRRIYQEGI